MRILTVAILCSIIAASCGRATSKSEIKYDSYHSVALDGTIDNGFIETTTTSDDAIRDQIIEQLHYTVGLLNTWMSVTDLSRTLTKSITITDKKKISADMWRIYYKASMTVSWSRAYQVPQEIQLILPASTDPALKMPRRFFDAYAVQTCLDPSTHDLGLGNFWYYIRPYNTGCSLGYQGQIAPLSVRFPMRLQMSSINTQGHAPEYQKFWEDGHLIVTAVFSKNNAGSQNPADMGVTEYNQFYQYMLRNYGRPTNISERVPVNGPGLEVPALTLEFRAQRGIIDVHMFLVDGMTWNGEQFDKRFGEATLGSDIVMYSGHAGLGGNVRGLAQKIQVRPGQYQLFMLNGCDTFAYIDDEIMLKHKAANPDASNYKFVDIIANSMPSYFQNNANNSMTLINAANGANLNYRQILSYFDQNQRAVVFGEEDNN